jgi:hypothetical protein
MLPWWIVDTSNNQTALMIIFVNHKLIWEFNLISMWITVQFNQSLQTITIILINFQDRNARRVR